MRRIFWRKIIPLFLSFVLVLLAFPMQSLAAPSGTGSATCWGSGGQLEVQLSGCSGYQNITVVAEFSGTVDSATGWGFDSYEIDGNRVTAKCSASGANNWGFDSKVGIQVSGSDINSAKLVSVMGDGTSGNVSEATSSSSASPRRPAGNRMEDLTEKTLASERKFTGRLIGVDVLDVELPDGRRAKREVVRHGNAVAILARRPDGRFVFVRQFRVPAGEALVEAIAGGLEPGESPEAGARRETAEETGYDVVSLRFLTTVICTPGYCDERIHLFFAELSATPHAQHQDADENVRTVLLTEDEVDAAVRDGSLCDGKTLAAWCCFKLARI